MKQNLKLASLTLLFCNLFFFTSCKKEPECKKCSAIQQIYQNGTLSATQNISAIQYCDDQLKQIEANPVVETTQSVGGFTQKSVITYTCQ